MQEQGVGQFFILGFRGSEIPGWLKDFEQSYGLGGVILFDYNCQTQSYENNIRSPKQLKELCSQIHSMRSRPLIFVDQEGGKVRRLKEKLGFAPLPSQSKFNQLSCAEQLKLIENSFKELKELGIDFNLSPVIDLNLNPLNPDIGAIERSYSVHSHEVRKNVLLLNDVAKTINLGLCLKHFPGLGGATVNSHEEITDLSDSIRTEQLELFYELGKMISGNAILISHGIVNPWDKDMPISMSKIGVGKLRQRLPEALLISDDCQMQGLQKRFQSELACILGIEAGLDMLCIGNNLIAEDAKTLNYAEAVAKKMTEDLSFRSQATNSLLRILRTKAQLNLFAAPNLL